MEVISMENKCTIALMKVEDYMKLKQMEDE